jgi:hypothetical protein
MISVLYEEFLRLEIKINREESMHRPKIGGGDWL